MFASSVSVAIILNELLRVLHTHDFVDQVVFAGFTGGLREALGFLGPAVLLLTAGEALAGWSQADRAQRRHRLIFLSLFIACVTLCTLAPGLSAGWPWIRAFQGTFEATSALAILIVTNVLIQARTACSIPATLATLRCSTDGPATDNDERELATAILRAMEQDKPFLRPELKVADLATELGAKEYRVSRAIGGALGEPNFNRFINRYRIEHAKQLLTDPEKHTWSILVIGLESGFASIGPFNRAFKATMNVTPSAYRKAHEVRFACSAS